MWSPVRGMPNGAGRDKPVPYDDLFAPVGAPNIAAGGATLVVARATLVVTRVVAVRRALKGEL